MAAFLTSLQRELRFLGQSGPELFAATALPLLLAALMAWIFSAGVPRELPIALVDQDRSATSRTLARMLDAAPGVRLAARPTELEAAWTLMRRLEVYATVHVPADTYRRLARGETATLFAYYNGAYQTPSEAAFREIQVVVQALGARVAFEEAGMARGPAAVRAPPIEIQRTVLYNPQGSYEQYLGLLVNAAMLHLLLCLCVITAVGRELRDGTAAHWLTACDEQLVPALLGKIAPYLLAFTLYGMLSLWFIRELRGPGIAGSSALLLLAQFALYAAYAGIGLLFVGLTRNMTVSLSLAAFYAGASLAFANAVFPVETGSLFTRTWSALLPFTQYSSIHEQQVYFGSPPADALPHLGGLALFVLLGGGLGMLLYARAARDPASWGRR